MNSNSKQKSPKRQGISEEYYQQGRKYEYGFGGTIDIDQACVFYTKSARRGHVLAQFALSVLAVKESDMEEAVYWWKKAASNGHKQAKYNLILSFLQGVGTEKDIDKAFDLMQRGAAEGNGKIEYLLAREYYQGKNIPRNFELAAKHYLNSAKSGFQNSMNELSMMYSMGQVGGKAMPVVAYGLAKTVLDRGFKDAERTISAIEKTYKLSSKMKMEGVKQAKILLAEK